MYSYLCVLSNPGTWRESCHFSAKAYNYTLMCNIDSTIAFLNLLFGKQTQKISLNAVYRLNLIKLYRPTQTGRDFATRHVFHIFPESFNDNTFPLFLNFWKHISN